MKTLTTTQPGFPTQPLEHFEEDALLSFISESDHRKGLLLGLSPTELSGQLNVEPAYATALAAALELGRRQAVQERKQQSPFIKGGDDVAQFLAPRMAGLQVETFWVLSLGAKGQVLWEERVSQGTLTSSLVHPREVFSSAILHRAAALVVAHNHPSGDPQPSAQDRSTTRRLQRAGKLLGIELLDHVILAQGRWVSFLEEGWL